MSELGFNKSDVDAADEFASAKVYNPISRAIISVANENTTKYFHGEYVYVSVFQAEIGPRNRKL
jgi:hypothetical protein